MDDLMKYSEALAEIEDNMDPTVMRLNKELKQEKAAGRHLKKNWRQAQADHHAAAVEATRLGKELEMTQQALLTSQEIGARLEAELHIKQSQFMKSDVRAGLLNKDLLASKQAQVAQEKVEKKFTSELIDLRNEKEHLSAQIPPLVVSEKNLKAEVLRHKEKWVALEVEARGLRETATLAKKKVYKVDAECHELGRRLKDVLKDKEEAQKLQVHAEHYAEKMRKEAEAISVKLKKETQEKEKVIEDLKLKTKEYLNEKEQVVDVKHQLKDERNAILGLRKGKNEAEAVVMAVQLDHHTLEHKLAEQKTQNERLQQTLDGRIADVEMLGKKLAKADDTIAELTAELQAANAELKMQRSLAKEAKSDYKLAAEEVKHVRKEVADEKQAAMSVGRDLMAEKGKLKEHSMKIMDCEVVIDGLTSDLHRERDKLKETELMVENLKEKLRESERRFAASQDKVRDVEGILQATSNELSLTKRAAADSGTASTKLVSDISDVRSNLRNAEDEVVLLERSLENFRNDVLARESERDEERAKVHKLTETLRLKNLEIEGLKTEVNDQKKQIDIIGELSHLSERNLQDAKQTTQSVGLELHKAVSKQRYAENELFPVMEQSKRLMQQVNDLEAAARASEERMRELQEESSANLKRALAAEAINHGHEKIVADLEEHAAHAASHDQTASALSKKMAARLHEAQKKLPPLEKEVATYKEQVGRMVGELTSLQAEVPKYKAEVARLTKELQVSKLETDEEKGKMIAVEATIPPLKEKLCAVQDQLTEEVGLKKEMAKQLHAHRKRTADAEEQAKELTDHVTRLVEQLKQAGSDMGKKDEPRSPKSPKEQGMMSKLKGAKQTLTVQTGKGMPARALTSLPALK